MSANNYTDCPSCGLDGVVREDYEIGVRSGKFFVDYGAACCGENSGNPAHGCGFRHEFKHETVIPLEHITATLRTADGFEKRTRIPNPLGEKLIYNGKIFIRSDDPNVFEED